MSARKPRVLVACTGSVAAIKVPTLLADLSQLSCKPEIQLITTEHSRHFFDLTQVKCPVFKDENEWENWTSVKDPVLHIELRRWADVMVIAPLDANTLAKISNGICDNLLTCVVRAWDLERPLLFAPAMNTHMWNHPLTAQQITTLKTFGYMEIPCISKKLACGDTGMGAMAEVSTIVAQVEQMLSKVKTE
ncbi:phosphopantothenoylcysteine decarboxylase-like [Littorina saxatilis]|uniref:Phosphopantothenoylcysteine decarboxylase n=1 Tax=Littorina saxatilis TaxID=31220 RepID=A0AAN9GNP0_9CAEN